MYFLKLFKQVASCFIRSYVVYIYSLVFWSDDRKDILPAKGGARSIPTSLPA